MQSSASSQLKQQSIEVFKKSAFRNKYAEATCESLGISKSTIQRAYQEVEGMVSLMLLLRTRREISAQHAASASSSEEGNSSSKPKFKKIDWEKYNMMVFGKADLGMKGDIFFDNMDHWPKKWCRPNLDSDDDQHESEADAAKRAEKMATQGHEGKNNRKKVSKVQLQIPLANLLSPSLYSDDENDDENEIDDNNNDGEPKKSKCRSAIDLPPNLQKLAVDFERILASYVEEIVQDFVPSSIEKGLFPGLKSFLNREGPDAKSPHPRSMLLARMRSKAVLRLWIYFGDKFDESVLEKDELEDDDTAENVVTTTSTTTMNSTKQQQNLCRGHFDPGICSILLSGSQSGLQLHKTFVGNNRNHNDNDDQSEMEKPPANGDDDDDNDIPKQQNSNNNDKVYTFATHDVFNQAQEEDWVNVGYSLIQPAASLLQQQQQEKEHLSENNTADDQFSSSNVVLMNGTMMQIITGGVAQHAFHRVSRKNKNPDQNRIQIVFELRPDNAAKWYSFTPTEEEKKNLARY